MTLHPNEAKVKGQKKMSWFDKSQSRNQAWWALARMLHPYKSLRLYAHYLDDAERLAMLGGGGLDVRTLRTDPISIAPATLFTLTIHQLYLTLVPSESGEEATARLDVLALACGTRLSGLYLHLAVAMLALLTVHFFTAFYLRLDLSLLYLMRRLLFDATERVMVATTFRGIHVRVLVRRMATATLALYQALASVTYILVGLGSLHWLPILDRLLRGRHLVTALWHLTLITLALVSVAAFVHVMIVSGLMLMVLIFVLWVRAVQANAMLRSWLLVNRISSNDQQTNHNSNSTSIRPRRGYHCYNRYHHKHHQQSIVVGLHRVLDRFVRADIGTVELISTANGHFSPMVLSYALVNSPLAALIAITLMLVHSESSNRPLLATLCLATVAAKQSVVMVVMHLVQALLTSRIYASVPLLYGVSTASCPSHNWSLDRVHHSNIRYASLRDQLVLFRTIARLHTTRASKVGFTYGPFGLVSIASFGKYALLFGEMLMYAHMYLVEVQRKATRT